MTQRQAPFCQDFQPSQLQHALPFADWTPEVTVAACLTEFDVDSVGAALCQIPAHRRSIAIDISLLLSQPLSAASAQQQPSRIAECAPDEDRVRQIDLIAGAGGARVHDQRLDGRLASAQCLAAQQPNSCHMTDCAKMYKLFSAFAGRAASAGGHNVDLSVGGGIAKLCRQHTWLVHWISRHLPQPAAGRLVWSSTAKLGFTAAAPKNGLHKCYRISAVICHMRSSNVHASTPATSDAEVSPCELLQEAVATSANRGRKISVRDVRHGNCKTIINRRRLTSL